MVEEGDRLRPEACQSPVWDTALAVLALRDCRRRPRRTRARAARPSGCSTRRSRSPATGRSAARELAPGGWAFEFENDLYPDVDDTAVVALALRELGIGRRRRRSAASPGSAGMQSRERRLGRLRRRQRRATGSTSSRSATSARSSTRRARTSPRTRSRRWPGRCATRTSVRARPRLPARASSSATAPGGAAGASTTSTAPARSCRRSRRAVSRPSHPAIRTCRRVARLGAATTTAASARTSARTTSPRGAGAARRPPSQTAWALLAYVAAGEATERRRPGERPTIFARQQAERRLGRGALHRDRVSDRFHDPLSPVPAPLPVAGASAVYEKGSLDEVSASLDGPDRQLRRPAAAQGRALPARADARADARVQHRLHRLREDPRVRVEQGAAVGRRVHRRRRAVPGARSSRSAAASRSSTRGSRTSSPASSSCGKNDRPLHERAPAGASSSTSSSPTTRLTFVVHLDGMREIHDYICDYPGLWDVAVDAIKQAREAGLPRHDEHDDLQGDRSVEDVIEMMGYLTNEVGIDGMLIAPGYQYSQIDPALTMTRDEHEEKFRAIRAAVAQARLPLAGEPDLPGLPHRRAQAAVRAVGLDHAQPVRLEGPVLPAHGRHLPDLRGAARGHRVGVLRPRQRPALRALRRSTPGSSPRPPSRRPAASRRPSGAWRGR